MGRLQDNMAALRGGENGDLIERMDATGKPFAIYAEILERGALEQFAAALAHDSVDKAALMPDAHTGYALPIGGVVASRDAVFPAFVGYDKGCGMCAIPLDTEADALRAGAEAVFRGVYAAVPVGREHNREETPWDEGLSLDRTPVVQSLIDQGCFRQIGSLGDGNHFIEIGADGDGRSWIVCHSGSRNVGHRVATHYMTLAASDERAVEACFANRPGAGRLIDEHRAKMASGNKGVMAKAMEDCFGLAASDGPGVDYLVDLAFALEFALANRREIIRRVAAVIEREVGGRADWDRLVNRNHNHAELSADGHWVHRKGATHAERGMMGVIPGNMRDGSFIVRGLGNADSLCSSSHGAGRVLSRGAASKTLSVDDFKSKMDGIVARVGADTLDESPDAYKNIYDVMAAQSELVEVVAHSRPIINVKGFDKDGGWKAKKRAKAERRKAEEAAAQPGTDAVSYDDDAGVSMPKFG
jgi:tRNA-splicing ligase RtcB